MSQQTTPKTLGIIPARGGSKRLPKKNIRILGGIPLIAHTIRAAQESRRLDHFIVSTEDSTIADIARQFHAEVPFVRPVALAEDQVKDRLVLQHAVEWMRDNQQCQPDLIVYLRPTTPFKTAQIIDAAIEMLIETGADSVRSVTKAEGVHHPYWMFTKDEANKSAPAIQGISIDQYYQSQLLPPVYRLNGVVEVIRTEVLLHHAKLYGDDMRLLELPEKVSIDIDTEMEFQLCEFLLASG